MKILVIGGTGFISTRLVQKLLAAGHKVTIFNRGKSRSRLPQHDRLTVLHGDRSDAAALQSTLTDGHFDAAYDMVAYLPEESELVARVFRGKVGRFIHCSTVSVYMVSAEVQCPVDEEQDAAPLMPFFERNPFGMTYGINKRKCEQVLREAHDENEFPVSMLRPTYVCGPHDPMLRDFFWIERILDGKPVPVSGSGDYAFQHVYVDDVAQAFADLLDYPESVGRAYNVASEEIFSLNDYLAVLSRLLGRSPDLVHIPQEIFDAQPFSSSSSGDAFPFNTRRTAIFSLDKIKRDLNYHSTPFRKWMPETVDWCLQAFTGHSVGYEWREEEVAFAERWQKWQQDLKQRLLSE